MSSNQLINALTFFLALLGVMLPLYIFLWKHYKQQRRNSLVLEGREIRTFANTAAEKVIWKNIFDYLVYKTSVKERHQKEGRVIVNVTDYILAQAPGQLTDVLVQGGINPETFSIDLLLKETLSKIITNHDLKKLEEYDLKEYTQEELAIKNHSVVAQEPPNVKDKGVV